MNVFSFFLAVQSACSIADGTFFVIKWLLYLYLFVANVQIIMASSKYPLTFFYAFLFAEIKDNRRFVISKRLP